MDRIDRECALATIQEHLAPLIGHNLAHSSVKLHSEKLTLNGAQLSRDQANALLGQIALGLRVFVGAEKAEAMTERIFATLFREDG